MSREGDIIAFNREAFKSIKEELFNDIELDVDINTIHTMFLTGDWHDETYTWIASPIGEIFDNFFNNDKSIDSDRVDLLNNGKCIGVTEAEYNNMVKWVEHELEKVNLLDIAKDKKNDSYFHKLVSLYRNMKDKEIDFKTDFMIFQLDSN